MKKLLCIAFAAVCLCACGSDKTETKTMTCKLNQETNGMTIDMTVDIDYDGTGVLKQTQKSNISAESDEVYEVMEPALLAESKEEAYKGMSGVTYDLKTDKAKRLVTESVVIDFDKVKADDYKTMTGIDISNAKISLDKTKENLEKQQMTCTK